MLSNDHQQLRFVCHRVADTPTPEVLSQQGPCARCDAPIWVPKKSPVALPKICIRCTGPDSHTDFWSLQGQEARQAAHRVENPEAADLLAKADEYDRFAACNREWETQLLI